MNTEIAECYRKAADRGDAWAQLFLGICYYNGEGVAMDKAEAAKWYLKAAKQGNALAQYNLGVCYAFGYGVEKDFAEAVKLFRQAAGHAKAQYSLGCCYYYGRGVTKGYHEAVIWWRKAADQGDAMAQYRLGICYANGEGVTENKAEAEKWYWKAAEQGLAEAKNTLAVLYKESFNFLWIRAELSDAQKAVCQRGKNYHDIVVTTGRLPHENTVFNNLLLTQGINACTPSEDIGIIIVGKEFNPTILGEQINLRIGQSLFVYSQEMFLSRLAGKDPYDDKNALKKFTDGHQVFEYLNTHFFTWKTTHIVPTQGGTVKGEWTQKGVLDDSGYHVGNAGVERNERHKILTRVFTTKLNNVTSLEYMAEWGTPNSCMRLQKMADSIASFACNAKRQNNPRLQQAIDDWEEDLGWLKKTYYDGKFSFDWRSTFVR